MFSVKKYLAISLFATLSISLSGCPAQNFIPEPSPVINLEKSTIKISEKVLLDVAVNKKANHQYTYRFAADKGTIESSKVDNDSKATYTAPATDGIDTIKVTVFDLTDNINLPVGSKEITINK